MLPAGARLVGLLAVCIEGGRRTGGRTCIGSDGGMAGRGMAGIVGLCGCCVSGMDEKDDREPKGCCLCCAIWCCAKSSPLLGDTRAAPGGTGTNGR